MSLEQNDYKEKQVESAKKFAPKEKNKMILFPQSDKKSEKSPDFKGYLSDDMENIYIVSGWSNTSNKGTKYLSASLEKIDLTCSDVGIPF
jgi:uncharacterized protein (DUF736 family)